MNRREFLRSASYVGSALVLGATVPRFIGEPAGGFYAPVPNDLKPHLRIHPAFQPMNHLGRIQLVTTYAVWAPPDAKYGALAEFAGSMQLEPAMTSSLLAAKLVNLEESIRECLESHHEAGWFKVRVPRETMDLDSDGDPVIAYEDRWKRVGYVKWLTIAELDQISRKDMVLAA